MLMRVLVMIAWLVAGAVHAHAETVALLPLDGEKRLEIYGQPVAAEIGRALKAHGYDVVVVGAKMDVPDNAQLIVDGTIKSEKGSAISLTIRIRDPRDGTTLETLPASAAALTAIDKAAADVSAKLVPAVKKHFAALAAAATKPTNPEPPITSKPNVPVQPPPAALPLMIISVSSPQAVAPALERLATGLGAEFAPWAERHARTAKPVTPEQMSRATAIQTVAGANANLGLALEVLSFDVTKGDVPLARARVRARIIHKGTMLFERVIRTDTIVGDKGISDADMAARTAREVLAIANAQLRRLVAGWR